MDVFDTSEAKARLDELVVRAAAGEEIEITGGGDVSVRLVAAGPVSPRKRKPLDIEEMKRIAAMGPPQEESAGDFIRRLRDADEL
jgi:antitoxin (DNA-binding transcriptional repressor) of toxin-antitoxin stability system